MDRTDDTLAGRVAAGDATALGEYLERQRRPLLAYVERSLGAALRRKVEPQDIVQEVAVAALRALPDADLVGRDPFAWLCQIAEQRIIDAHRKFYGAQKRAADREVGLDAPAGGAGAGSAAGIIDLLVVSMTSPSQALSRDQRAFRVAQALAALPDVQREALRLRYVEDLPSKEIARRLGKTDGAVRVLLTRSLRRLQELLPEDRPPSV
jgi:RNA polymerase sigma-70 factor (ECF subfamily)